MSKKANQDIKQLRAIGHKLKPIVTVAGKGLSENVLTEIDRALSDHEFIKIKLAVGGRDARTAVSEELCERTGAEIVQSVGNVILVLRRSSKPDPKLSNLIRPVA
jgi:RNA-binding protein